MRALLAIGLVMLMGCSKPVENEAQAVEKAQQYIESEYDLIGSIAEYRIKVWDDTSSGSDSLYSIYFVHESKYQDYANDQGVIEDAYAAIPPESFHVDVYTADGEIDDLTYSE